MDAPSRQSRILVIDDSATILKVVGTILQRNGYDPVTARDGVEGLERLRNGGPVDLVLLDFVMPRMNGYQFCRELRADPVHHALPVVLMSARSDAIRDRFVEQTGAVDALGKPFDARALVAVVGGVLAKAAEGAPGRRIPEADIMVDESELEEVEAETSGPPPSRHMRTLGRFAAQIAGLIVKALRNMQPDELAQTRVLEDAIIDSLSDDVLMDLVRTVDELDAPKATSVVMRGELSGVPLAEVMQLLQLQRQSGTLRVYYKNRSMTLFISAGHVDLVQSKNTQQEFRLGRYFIEKGLLDRNELKRILERQPPTKLLGELLVEEGKITDEQRREALTRQSSELVYELLRWPSGRFTFSEEPFPDTAKRAALGLGVSELVLEGFRRVDEWRQMEGTIHFDDVVMVDQMSLGTLGDAKIGPAEKHVLSMADGERTVQQIIETSALASFDAIRIIYSFLQSRILRTKPMVRTKL
ncbi:MAG: response regulator [Myxococcales bacterium]|nr:response regulator [Myxococcales bacterium]